jgi:alpha-1,2-mannosyltransferase
MREPASASWLERMATAPQWRIAVVSFLGLALAFRVVQVAVGVNGPAWGYDFTAYFEAAQRIAAGDPLYASEQLAGPYSPQLRNAYLYPPFLAVLLVPIATLFDQARVAMWAWAALNLTVLVLATVGLGMAMRLRALPIVVLVLAVVGLPAVGFELVMGNVHLLLVALYVGAWLAIRQDTRRGDIVAGVAIGVAMLVKLFPGVLLVWLLLQRRFAAAAAALMTTVVLAAATVPVVGVEAWLQFPRVVANIGPPPDPWSSISPASVLAPAVGSTIASAVVLVVGLGVLVWTARTRPLSQSFAVAMTVSALVVPTMYPHYLALLAGPALLLVVEARSLTAVIGVYATLFVGSQAALLDLREVANRALAVLAGPVMLVLASVRRQDQQQPSADVTQP